MKEIIQQLQSLGSRSLEENVRLCGRLEAETNRRNRFLRISWAIHLPFFFIAAELLVGCWLYLSDCLTVIDLTFLGDILANIYGVFPLNKIPLIVWTCILAGALLFLPTSLDRIFANICEDAPERKPSSRMNKVLKNSDLDGKLSYIKTTLTRFVRLNDDYDSGWHVALSSVFGYALEITGIPLCIYFSHWLEELGYSSSFGFIFGLLNVLFILWVFLPYIFLGGCLFGTMFCSLMPKFFLNKWLSADQRKIVAILETYDVYAEKVRLDAMSPEERRRYMEEKARREREEKEEKRKEEAERAKAMLWALNNKSSFDSDTYVSEHCESYKYGIAAEVDVKRIENDSSLTSSQKEAAKSELRRKADMYD